MFLLIHGKNTFDSYVRLDKIRKEFANIDFEIQIVDADEIEIGELLYVLDFSENMFAKKKLVILKRLNENTPSVIEKFCSFVRDNKDNSAVNLVLWEDDIVNKKSKLNEVLKYFKVEFFENAKDYEKRSEAENFAKSLSNNFELNLNSSKITEILDKVGYEKFDIYFELKKFNTLKKNNFDLNFESLSMNENYNVFEFISSFWKNNYSSFLKLMKFIMLDKQNYSLILSLLVSRLISNSQNKVLRILMELDFRFKSGLLEEEDVFVLTYNQINLKNV